MALPSPTIIVPRITASHLLESPWDNADQSATRQTGDGAVPFEGAVPRESGARNARQSWILEDSGLPVDQNGWIPRYSAEYEYVPQMDRTFQLGNHAIRGTSRSGHTGNREEAALATGCEEVRPLPACI